DNRTVLRGAMDCLAQEVSSIIRIMRQAGELEEGQVFGSEWGRGIREGEEKRMRSTQKKKEKKAKRRKNREKRKT
ncbi:hypothetical protein, partial [Serratia ureilytica]|uniref:hypothetical protein n=1 Tax=Serratia ureilytica TaxID=300181 RepID=UPI0034C6C32E